MDITNPCKYFTNGSNREEFTYTPGSQVFQIHVRESSVIWINAIVFADNLRKAAEILEELVLFRLEKYEQYKNNKNSDEDYCAINAERCQKIITALQLPDKRFENIEVHINYAPRNQLYKTSWASNDNIL